MPVTLGSKVLVDRDVCWLGQDWYMQYRRQEQSRGASAPPTAAFGPISLLGTWKGNGTVAQSFGICDHNAVVTFHMHVGRCLDVVLLSSGTHLGLKNSFL